MTLADDAATGSADREAVAIALGCVVDDAGLRWFCHGRNPSLQPPDYQTDLAATLAEIERRGRCYLLNNIGVNTCIVFLSDHWQISATGTTIANAACAALLKALENSDD